MSRSADDRRVQRIAKLLALARDQQGKPEGETAIRMARDLMRQGLGTRVDLSDSDSDDVVEARHFKLGGVETWRRRLVSAVARHCACVVAWPRGSERVTAWGHPSHTEIAEYLYTVLQRELRAACPEGASSSFFESGVTALEGRLAELREGEARADPTGHSLIVGHALKVRSQLVAEGHRFERSPRSPYAWSLAGYEAGRSIPLVDGVGKAPEPDALDGPEGHLRARRSGGSPAPAMMLSRSHLREPP